ncbi:hypothetical protein BGW38_005380 [Lunasporangiospora selenospora]|uniref:Copper homeostasis protein cutC homolog n=1 Tax=Lunasporangiospora selenospora TaxID=979761 RepID=A0A9P6G0S2_9FUNG|nr:hypothetical protein BGW38_005380 [Lunasporangiospora selenospora]
MTSPIFEVCLDSVASAIIAESTGAKRVELCAGLMEGGITPSAGLISTVKAKTSLPVMVMIRPRGGDFCYDDDEFAAMLEDIELCKQKKVEGVVFGVLLPDGSVDKVRVKRLVETSHPMQGITERNVQKIVSAMNATEVHVGAGGTMPSRMEYRNPYCSMGYAIAGPEYELRLTSNRKLGGMIDRFD